MRPKPQHKYQIAVLAALALSATPSLADSTLVINGNATPADVRLLGGTAYVRLADVAKALGMTVVRHGSAYELIKAGGANQVEGLSGKVGDTLFNGQWRFQVVSVQTPDSYTTKTPDIDLRGISTIKYDEDAKLLSAATGYKLVVIQCRITNGQKSLQTFWLGHNDVKNALTDTQGESYPPFGYDLEGAPTQSKPLLPGAGTSFPIFFSVPEATQIKDLVFTLRNNDFSSKALVSDVRVSLKSP